VVAPFPRAAVWRFKSWAAKTDIVANGSTPLKHLLCSTCSLFLRRYVWRWVRLNYHALRRNKAGIMKNLRDGL